MCKFGGNAGHFTVRPVGMVIARNGEGVVCKFGDMLDTSM